MTAIRVPPALAALVLSRNAAVDATLAEVLPHVGVAVRPLVFELLATRGRGRSLATVVGRFFQYDADLQESVVQHVNGLFGGVRLAIESPEFAARAGAIEIVVRSDCGPLVYLLADALRSTCHRTRQLAANGLRLMTDRLFRRLEAEPPATEIEAVESLYNYLAEALKKAVRRWEIHLQPQVLEAALWMGSRIETAIRRKLQDPRTKIARKLNDLISDASNPRLAGFTVQALAMPELRGVAGRAIAQAQDEAFIKALLARDWLLVDADIEQGCRRIPPGRWLHEGVDEILRLEDDLGVRAVRLLAMTGGSHDRKIAQYRALLGADREHLHRAVVWVLVQDKSEDATELLRMVAARSGIGGSLVAKRELRRRSADLRERGMATGGAALPEVGIRHEFEEYWECFDKDNTESVSLRDKVRKDTGALLVCIRAKLGSSSAFERTRALQMGNVLGVCKALEEQIYRLAHDPDAQVRSQAVALLRNLPGSTARRLLRQAVDDPDERVQANAIEALDLLDVTDREKETKPKLESLDNRVRANAVKSLLRLDVYEAGDVLLDMLEDSSPANRLSALWVIEKLGLDAVLARLEVLGTNDPDNRVRQRAKQILQRLAASAEAGDRAAGPQATTAGGRA